MTEFEQGLINISFLFTVFVIDLVLATLIAASITLAKISSDYGNHKWTFAFTFLSTSFFVLLLIFNYRMSFFNVLSPSFPFSHM